MEMKKIRNAERGTKVIKFYDLCVQSRPFQGSPPNAMKPTYNSAARPGCVVLCVSDEGREWAFIFIAIKLFIVSNNKAKELIIVVYELLWVVAIIAV